VQLVHAAPSHTPAICLRVFDNRKSYYDPANSLGSVITPNTGTTITVKSISAIGGFMEIVVSPAK
jgi:immune inhibitor A